MGNRNYYHWNHIQKEKRMNDKQTLIKLEKEVRELKAKLKKQSDQRFWEKVAVESLISMMDKQQIIGLPPKELVSAAAKIADVLLEEKKARQLDV